MILCCISKLDFMGVYLFCILSGFRLSSKIWRYYKILLEHFAFLVVTLAEFTYVLMCEQTYLLTF